MSPRPDARAVDPTDDEVLAHRARLAHLVKIGKRGGYGLFAYAIVAFAGGAIFGFATLVVDSIVLALFIGSILLIPAIVFGYGIRAAEREERESTRAHQHIVDVDEARGQ